MRLTTIIVAVSMLLISGCAPGLGKTIRVDRFPVSDTISSKEVIDARSLPALRVMNFTDERSQSAVAKIDGRQVEADSDVGRAVQQAFQDELRAHGARVSQFEGAQISGAIQEWFIDVTPKFPATEAKATARIQVKVGDPNGSGRFSASYSGSVELKHPLLTQSRIEEALAQAMSYAVQAALSDDRVKGALGIV